MKISIIPKTAPGKWSLGLLGGLVVFFILFNLLVASGQRGGETFSDNLALAVPIMLAGACGIGAFFTGAIGIIWKRERAVLVFLAALVGLFVLMFAAGEVLVPH